MSHAPLSPSASYRWLECPGSVAASVGAPDESSVFAAEGTFAHDVAAACLQFELDAEDMVGQVGTADGFPFTFGDDDVGPIQGYLDLVRGLADDLAGGDDIGIEERVEVTDQVYGTADAVVRSRDGHELNVVDLKYGRGVLVDVRGNPQLMIYGLGALYAIRQTAYSEGVEVVRMHVFQPRHSQGGHSVEELTVEELLDWKHEVLEPGIAAASGGSEERRAGDWCKFCPAKVGCPAIRKKSLEVAVGVFEDLPNLTPAKTPMSPKDLSPTMIRDLLGAFPMVEAWIGSVREYAYKLVTAGGKVPGFKLVEKKTNRAWKDETRAADLIRKYGEEPFPPGKLLSPAQAEKAIGGKKGKAAVATMTKKPTAGTVLASDSDKRPAVSPGDVF